MKNTAFAKQKNSSIAKDFLWRAARGAIRRTADKECGWVYVRN